MSEDNFCRRSTRKLYFKGISCNSAKAIYISLEKPTWQCLDIRVFYMKLKYFLLLLPSVSFVSPYILLLQYVTLISTFIGV